MKKELLFMAALALSSSAFAQQEAGWIAPTNDEVIAAWGYDAETGKWASKGDDENPHNVAGGTLMAETENVVLRTTFDDRAAVSSINKLGLNYWAVNNVAYTSPGNGNSVFNGAAGNTNPGAIDFESGIVVNKGWVLDYEVKKDGYLTVFFQLSLNKNYYVIENGEPLLDGALNPEASYAMAYDCYMATKVAPEGLEGNVFAFKLPADEGGYIDFESADFSKYSDGKCILWPYRILMGSAEAAAGSYDGNNDACVIFPVSEGYHYYFFATGSKVTAAPFAFTEEYPTQVAFVKEATEDSDQVVYNLVGEYTGAGVEGVAAVADKNAPVYNLMGVRVNADAKGILIQNGKKFIRK